MTVVSGCLTDRIGRRTLLLVGFSGMFAAKMLFQLSVVLLKYSGNFTYTAVTAVFVFVICYGVGPGSIPSIFLNDVFTVYARGKANSVVSSISWLFVFLIQISGCGCADSTTVAIFNIFLLYRYMPETSKKNVIDVHVELDYLMFKEKDKKEEKVPEKKDIDEETKEKKNQ
uniref:Uncharacterized protein n=1 Tax=Meloidogyne enterolobii TaxID=390850 RepID=A0A6V7U5N9_MELEN|nr:unnamed protein product [Meloidogyne enterolobii]